jgi:hypothetical protein
VDVGFDACERVVPHRYGRLRRVRRRAAGIGVSEQAPHQHQHEAADGGSTQDGRQAGPQALPAPTAQAIAKPRAAAAAESPQEAQGDGQAQEQGHGVRLPRAAVP